MQNNLLQNCPSFSNVPALQSRISTTVRKKIWIPVCRGLIRKVLHDCLYCKEERIKPHVPLMSDLPQDRLDIHEKPFQNTGIDFFRPILVKLSKKTRANQAKAKRYGVIFTCMTTRAVHLEIAGDVSSDSFILSLRCFIAHRGNVKNIRSDNGTNFIGAEKELKAAINEIDKEKVMTEIIEKGIHFSWKFNPPSSPWMGGAWESLIKSVKRSLKAITLDRIFTEEALYTFLCEVESLLNNHPVTPSSDDINDYEALTPNHLILGNSSSNYSPCKCQNDEIYYRKKRRAVQAAANMFWNRWRKEYLPTMKMVPKRKKSKIRRLSNYTE